MVTTPNLPWNPTLPARPRRLPSTRPRTLPSTRPAAPPVVRAFRRSDLDRFAQRVASGEAWRDAWRSANDRFELFLFEARKTAERIDRRYSVARRLSAVAQSAADRAREIDREFEIGQRWRTFTLDFSRNWPRVSTYAAVNRGCVRGKLVVVAVVNLSCVWDEPMSSAFLFLLFSTRSDWMTKWRKWEWYPLPLGALRIAELLVYGWGV